MSFPQGPARRQQSPWDLLRHEIEDLKRRLRQQEGGALFRAAQITAQDDGLLFNGKIYFTTDTGGNIEPAELQAYYNGANGRNTVLLRPPRAVGTAEGKTRIYVEGPAVGSPEGRVYVLTDGTLHLQGEDGFFLHTDDDVSTATHAVYTATADQAYRAPHRHYFATTSGGGTGTRGMYVEGTVAASGSKTFVIDHPTKPGMSLRHAATESPVSGLEYHYRATLDDTGEAVIGLPEYFEALAAPDGRGVQVTPVGRPFPVGAEEPTGGRVVVYGDPGRDVFVRVNARRGDDGGQFEVETPREAPPEEAS